MRVASITEAKNQLSALIDHVRSGESILIVDRGIPVARLEPATPLGDDEGRLARLQRSGVVRVGRGKLSKEFLSRKLPILRGNASAVDVIIEERRTGR